jgi:hypothetical protein
MLKMCQQTNWMMAKATVTVMKGREEGAPGCNSRLSFDSGRRPRQENEGNASGHEGQRIGQTYRSGSAHLAVVGDQPQADGGKKRE